MSEDSFYTTPQVPRREFLSVDNFNTQCEALKNKCDRALVRIHTVLSAGTETRAVASLQHKNHNIRIILTQLRDDYEALGTIVERRGRTPLRRVLELIAPNRVRADDPSDYELQIQEWKDRFYSCVQKEYVLLAKLYEQENPFGLLRHEISPLLTELALIRED